MKKSIVYIILPICLVLLFTDCSRSRRTRTRTYSHKTPVTPTQPKIKPENKHDTVYIIVPQEPTVPNQPTVIPSVTPDGDDLIIVVPTNKKLKPVVHKDNLPIPPQIDFKKPHGSHTRADYIKNHNIIGNMKDLITACDYDNKTVRNNAVALVAISSGNFNLGQICDIFDFCYQNWSYVNDPVTLDYFSKASETLRNGLNGDCDDFAILLCALICAIGGEARISFAYDNNSGHAFTEVNIGKTDRLQVEKYLTARYGYNEMWHKEDSYGNWWLNMDWQAQYPGGQYWKYNHGTMFNIIQNIYQNL